MISKSSSFDNKPRFKPQKQKWPQQEVVKLQILCRDVILDMCVKFPSNPKTQSCEKQQYLPNGSFSKIAVTDHNNKKTCLYYKRRFIVISPLISTESAVVFILVIKLALRSDAL